MCVAPTALPAALLQLTYFFVVQIQVYVREINFDFVFVSGLRCCPSTSPPQLPFGSCVCVPINGWWLLEKEGWYTLVWVCGGSIWFSISLPLSFSMPTVMENCCHFGVGCCCQKGAVWVWGGCNGLVWCNNNTKCLRIGSELYFYNILYIRAHFCCFLIVCVFFSFWCCLASFFRFRVSMFPC